jgi:hypothetical protein
VLLVAGGATTAQYNQLLTDTGANTLSTPAGGYGNEYRGAATVLSANVESGWARGTYPAGAKIIPNAMMGWDTLPIVESPLFPASGQVPHRGEPSYVAATTAQLAAHLLAARDYVNANPSRCEANVVLAHAWNEHYRGSWLCPTKGEVAGVFT